LSSTFAKVFSKVFDEGPGRFLVLARGILAWKIAYPFCEAKKKGKELSFLANLVWF